SVWCQRVCSVSPSVPEVAVAVPLATVPLTARSTIAPFRATTAPIGTSSVAPAARAPSSAAVMPSRSTSEAGVTPRIPPPASRLPLLRTRRLGRRRRHSLEAQVRAILGAVHPNLVTLGVAPLEHRERQGVLEQTLDGALQRPGAVHRVVSLGHEQLLRGGRHVERELAVSHELRHPRD